jgi:hypothetical protein
MASREAEDGRSEMEPVQSRDEIMPEVKEAKLSAWDVVYALNMAIACLIAYWITTHVLFVFRETRVRGLSAGFARLVATCVSFALCLFYLLLFPFYSSRDGSIDWHRHSGNGTAGAARRYSHSRNNDRCCHGRRGNEP